MTDHKNALDLRFQCARSLIDEAASLALSLRPAPGKAQAKLKGKQDYVTKADHAVEDFIRRRLGTLFPEDSVLGEEEGGDTKSMYQWVVDPIDGTSNFARGRHRWCISLALLVHQKPVIGMIHAPALGDVFTAQDGKGAFLNNHPIKASQTSSMDEAMVEVGWSPYVPKNWFEERMSRLLQLGTMPRSLGSGALALADVACGRSDGYLEKVIFLWDVAAALVLLKEAGAHVSPFIEMGGASQPTTILASAPQISSILSQQFGIELR